MGIMWAKVVAFAEDFFVFIGAWVFEARAFPECLMGELILGNVRVGLVLTCGMSSSRHG